MKSTRILAPAIFFALAGIAPVAVHAADPEAAKRTLTVLHTFLSSPTDGRGMNDALTMDSAGNLYGTTLGGGPGNCETPMLLPGCGIAFQLAPPKRRSGLYTETILHAFEGLPDGANSQATLTLGPGASYYGTTLVGGVGNSPGLGTIYELTPLNGGTSWNYSTIIAFNGEHGGPYIPEANITNYNGTLYTTAQNGGVFGNYGAVIELVQNGSTWSYNVLHSFDGTDGLSIQAALTVDPATGVFYGVAQNGGLYNQGTIWELAPPAAGSTTRTFTKLYDFTGGADGGYIYATATLGPNGVLYGVAQNFGQYGKGTLWTMSPTTGGGWTFAVIHQFGETAADASTPVANVIVTADGKIYGTSELGGTYNKGAAFEFTPKSRGGYREDILWNFSGGSDGSFPFAAPLLVSAREMIGSCSQGASANAGTVWDLKF
jgi:hypothetical protein